jgi:hypothetical protein
VTGEAVDSVEKYYTDATGSVVRVDTYAGIRVAWSPELNKPVPNVTYNVVAKVDGGAGRQYSFGAEYLISCLRPGPGRRRSRVPVRC